MNCPKCGWPGLIGGTLKKRLAEAQRGNEIRMDDTRYLREQIAGARALLTRARRTAGARADGLVEAALVMLS